jgi:hypothetical protein
MPNEVSKSRISHPASFVWFLGFIGAFIYYVQLATGFWLGVLGFLKAIVWPAFLVYHLFEFLKI